MASLPGGVRIKGDVPTWKETRDLLADTSLPAQAHVALGKLLEERAAFEEAAAFYGRAGATAELERLRAQAVATGDGFLWLTACRHLGALPFPADEARALAATAEADGRLFDARLAFDAIEDEAELARVEALIPTALPVKTVEQEVAEAVEDFEASLPDADVDDDDVDADADADVDGRPGGEGSVGHAKVGG